MKWLSQLKAAAPSKPPNESKYHGTTQTARRKDQKGHKTEYLRQNVMSIEDSRVF